MASFFTYNNIAKLIEKNKCTGENLNAKYFWSSDMILIDEISSVRIIEVINHLIRQDEFRNVFKRLN